MSEKSLTVWLARIKNARTSEGLAMAEDGIRYIFQEKDDHIANLEAQLAEIKGLQRYDVDHQSYTTNNPNGEWIRAKELQAIFDKYAK